jgi:hypothetical protein
MKRKLHSQLHVRRPRRGATGHIGLLLLTAALGCGAPAWQTAPHDRLFQRVAPGRLHPPPAPIEASDWWESFYHNSFDQFGRMVSPGHHVQLAFEPEVALDVNAFGQVPDSTWFENRIRRRPMTADEIRRGPNQKPGPAPGKLLVKSGKLDGVTPGLVVKDGDGDRWIVKFDPPAYPELCSAAEVITTKLLHAVGYHVPENHVVHFALNRLELAEDATTRDDYGDKVPFTRRALDTLLAQLSPEPDGRVRAMFSRYLPGKPLGPYPLRGRRLDDPNDRIPHERRRSLRGLWVFYAWLNDTDAKMPNSLDTFIELEGGTPGLGHVKHYLIDFGSSLGASPSGPKGMTEGFEHTVDWEHVFGRILTLGIPYPYWSTARRTPLRSVGQFESRVFDPARWRPLYPNDPFERADARDTFWAASILARLRLPEIAAAVSAGEYSDPAAHDWVLRTLMERREKLLRHAFEGFVPLDAPAVADGSRVTLVDLEVAAELRASSALSYRYRLVWERGADRRAVAAGSASLPEVELAGIDRFLLRRFGSSELASQPFFSLEVRRASSGEQELSAEVRLRRLASGRFIAIGFEHVPRR